MTTKLKNDREPPVETENCRAMARLCEWKAQSDDPDAREQWLDLARRWRGLAAQIDAGDNEVRSTKERLPRIVFGGSKIRLRRQAKRRPMRRAVAVSFWPVGKSLPCVVWDMTDSGARLAIAWPTADLPHSFHLLLTKDGSISRECEVVWTNSRFVGVEFL